jgi:glycosyltransferase involved in cell wall biosynthesis
MKILHVNMSIDPITGGGTAERIVQIARAMSKGDCDISILTLDIGITNEVKRNLKNINLILLKCINKRFYIPGFDFTMISKIVKNSDMIHMMGHWTLINAIVYYYIKKFKRPFTICPAGALPLYGRSKFFKKIYNLLIGNRIVQNADQCIAITKKEYTDFDIYKIGDQKIKLIPNGINLEDYKYQDNTIFKEKYDIKKKIILFLGRLNYIKGLDLLIEAFIDSGEHVKDYQLVIIGPDEGMLKPMEKIVKKSDRFDDILFLGYIGGKEKSMAFHAADLVVIPSRQEAMSIVVLEAGISGTPVVMTDQCGFNEIESINGGLIVSASVKGIKSGIHKILSDPEKLIEKGENLKQFCHKFYTWNASAEKYSEIHKQFIHY